MSKIDLFKNLFKCLFTCCRGTNCCLKKSYSYLKLVKK